MTSCPIIKKALDNDVFGSLIIVLIGVGLIAVMTWLSIPTNIIVLIIGIGFFSLLAISFYPVIKHVYDYFKNKPKKDDDS